jgi:hypothetical protein
MARGSTAVAARANRGGVATSGEEGSPPWGASAAGMATATRGPNERVVEARRCQGPMACPGRAAIRAAQRAE